jgi:tetratricopeptide (TPR) repeat protein
MNKTTMRFPRLVAGAAFLAYALTVSRGVTLSSLPLASKVAGWDWLPMSNQPLTWLLTLPLHLLPGGWIPVVLNLLSAVLAALILGVLVRSIELLPWDCPPDENKTWMIRLPVLLACAVCGMEFNFWQQATAATGEMIDLLLLSAAIWCLLEYRVEKNPRWVNAAALVWGLGMAQNWAMLLTLPLFVAALIWLRGMRFFKLDFLVRMTLLGLAGFSIYALQPLANWLMPHSPWGFGSAWMATLRSTKTVVGTLYHQFWQSHRLMTGAVLLYFLVPTLPCFVRMKNEAAPNLSKLDRFQIWIYRALRVALLLACLWLAFDPEIGPRQMMRQQLGVELPLLTFDYLNALGIAMLAGNLLFASQIQPQRRARTAIKKFNSLLRRAAPLLLVAASALVVMGLLARSLPAILLANRQPLQEYGALIERSLPASGGIVFGDDTVKMEVLQAALARRGEQRRWLVVNTRLLPEPEYRDALERKFPAGWISDQSRSELDWQNLIPLLNHLSHTNRLFYLQPEAGNFIFESFFPQPQEAVHELKHYETISYYGPPLLSRQIQENEKFWDDAWKNEFQPVSELTSHWPPAWTKIFPHRFGLAPVAPEQSQRMGRWFSAMLDLWGVELQRNGKFTEAHRRFEQSLALNANNAAVLVNLQSCTNLLAGKAMGLANPAQIAEQLKNIAQITQLINACGPFDEPAMCCVLGDACASAAWPRQALQQFDRATVLAPDAVTPKLAMAKIYSQYRMDVNVFEIVNQLRKKQTDSPAGLDLELELSVLEAKSWMSQTNPARANGILQSILQRHPDEAPVRQVVFKTYLAFGEYTNALELVDRQLAKEPDNATELNNKAGILIQTHNSAAAIPILNRALSFTNVPAIRLNRAIAYLETQDYPAAEKDFLLLENSYADKVSVEFGLAEIASQRHDTNAAIRHLELCLSNAPPESVTWQEARASLDALKNPARR